MPSFEVERSRSELRHHNVNPRYTRFILLCVLSSIMFHEENRIGFYRLRIFVEREFRINAFTVNRCFTANREPLCHPNLLSQQLRKSVNWQKNNTFISHTNVIPFCFSSNKRKENYDIRKYHSEIHHFRITKRNINKLLSKNVR